MAAAALLQRTLAQHPTTSAALLVKLIRLHTVGKTQQRDTVAGVNFLHAAPAAAALRALTPQPVHHPPSVHARGVVSLSARSFKVTFTNGDVNCRVNILEFARASSDTTFCHTGSRWPIRIACVAVGLVGHFRLLLRGQR